MGEGNGNLFQYCCLENPMDGQRSQLGYSPWGNKESDTTERLHFLSFFFFESIICNFEAQFSSVQSLSHVLLFATP